jgi:hypothetical protein
MLNYIDNRNKAEKMMRLRKQRGLCVHAFLDQVAAKLEEADHSTEITLLS